MPILLTCLQAMFQILVVDFLICELGERVSREYETFYNKLCECDWYALSIEMQQKYLIFLAHTQQTPNISCFGNVTCTRETFKKVISNSNINYTDRIMVFFSLFFFIYNRLCTKDFHILWHFVKFKEFIVICSIIYIH